MKKSNIKEVVLAITYKCNSKCRMCNIWRNEEKREINVSDLGNFPENVKRINITGGEPFLHSDIVGIIKFLKTRNPKANIIISSNGFATELIIKRIEEILKIDPKIGVAISVDGIGKRHNEIRGIEGGFAKVVNTLDALKYLGVDRLKISYTIGDYNYNEIELVYELAGKYGAEFTSTVVHSSENYFAIENKINRRAEIIKKLEWLIRQEITGSNLKKMARAYFLFGLKEFLRTGKRILPDYSGDANIFIDPTGNIYPNDIAKNKIGHLSDFKLSEISAEDKDLQANSWMYCTVRDAMKRNPHKVMAWVAKEKAAKGIKFF